MEKKFDDHHQISVNGHTERAKHVNAKPYVRVKLNKKLIDRDGDRYVQNRCLQKNTRR